MLDSLLSLIAPHVCLGCSSEGALWCASCQQGAPLAVERCFRCHALSAGGRTCPACRRTSALYSVQEATRYEEVPKQVVWRLKFGRARAGAKDVARLMKNRVAVPSGAIITHIPTSTSHVRRRGYDQAQLIARAFAAASGQKHQPLLMRLGQAEQHTVGRAQRLTQLQHAFVVVRPDMVRDQHIVLIDDVITTGATLNAAATALKAAGAKRISALVFAQA